MIQEISKLAQKKGYVIYEEPYRLNIWGFRANSQTPNAFDDEMHVFTNIAQTGRPKWLYMVFKCTTDPGTFWLKNPMNAQGTAILNPSQYIDTYQIGLHRGKYKALIQTGGKVNVTRDYDRDAVLDFNNGKVGSGFFGINIHRASQIGSTLVVDKYSAGCQVFKSASDFDFFMKLCEVHRSFHGNKFTYTLVDERMESRQELKTIAISGILIALLLGGCYLIATDNE
jgi:hypothetical protein